MTSDDPFRTPGENECTFCLGILDANGCCTNSIDPACDGHNGEETGTMTSEKFGNDAIAAYLYDLAGNGMTDEEAGNVQETGIWYGLLPGPILDRESGDTFELTEPHGLTFEDVYRLFTCAGAIVQEDSQGFVSADLYGTDTALRAAWDDILSDVEEASGPQDEDLVTTDGRTFYSHNRRSGPVLTVGDDEDRDDMLRAYMQATGFWPNVWSISDHGNAHRIAL